MKKPVIIGILFLLVVVGALVYSTMTLSQHKVEVCMEYQGRNSCRTASGTSQEFALRSAIQNACAEIASGVTETIGCQNTKPAKTNWIK